VRGAVVYATFAVILVFLPVVMLPGLAGRFFAPLGLSYVYDREFDRPSFAPPPRIPDGWTAGREIPRARAGRSFRARLARGEI